MDKETCDKIETLYSRLKRSEINDKRNEEGLNRLDYLMSDIQEIVELERKKMKEKSIEVLSFILENWIHGGDSDCIIAEFEEKLKIFKTDISSNKNTIEIAEETLKVLHDYLNHTKKNEYVYIYVVNKNDIQKFPEEISDRKGDYYIGDFVFNDECGFTKYKIRKDEYQYNCECLGHKKGNRVTLDIYLQDISETIYIDLVKNFIDHEKEIVVLLEEKNIIRCIYSNYMYASTNLDRKNEKYSFCVESIISKFMPYLKSENIKVIREVD